jgi:TolA-binding protein
MNRLRRTVRMTLVVGVALVITVPWVRAEDDPPEKASSTVLDRQQLAAQIGEVKQQLLELIREKDVQIEALQQRVAELEQALQQLQQAAAEERAEAVEEDQAAELAELRRLAEGEAMKTEPEAATEKETTFKARGLSLQALNPEISVTGDMFAFVRDWDETRKRTGFEFRNLGLHLESYLDPYTRFKAAIEVTPDEVELGEAYMTRYGVLRGVNLTFGKFRQQFGVVNRWHKHGLDQLDFPFALRQIFGEGGLNQIGVSLDWLMPRLAGSSQELTVQLTNGQNPRLFSGNTLGTPSVLLHYKNYRDLSKDTYLELGLTGLIGWRDEWQVPNGTELVTVYDSLPAIVYGFDLAMLWEPTERMRYRNLEWRSELYALDRDILAPDGSGRDTIDAWGAYSYLQSKLNRTLELGVRLDYYRPDTKDYVDLGPWLMPHAYPVSANQWGVSPYLTWQQSPWVRWRIEYDHIDWDSIAESENTLYLQLIFAAGPHKHERY